LRAREFDLHTASFPAPEEFLLRQFTRGLPLSFCGLFVYAACRLMGKKPKDFHGVCRYFEVGNSRSGFECGWFFVCGRNADELLKAHELGHGLFNANVGGFRTLALSLGSLLRYWYRRAVPVRTAYDAWWYEAAATACGREYLRRLRCPQEKSAE